MRHVVPFAFLASALALVAACDPDLTPVSSGTPVGGDGGPVTSTPAGDGGTSPTEQGDGGTTTSADGGTSEAGTPHVVDGVNDFTPGETLETSSANYTAYVAWDAQNVYFGMSGADIGATASSQKWVLVFVDGQPGNAGTDTGPTYDCLGSCKPFARQSKLPFSAGFHFQYKTDGSYTRLLEWDGNTWASAGFDPDVKRTGDFMELSLPRSVLGNPTTLKTHVHMIVEKPGDEWTYAASPKMSWTDGRFNPPQTMTKYFAFDLTSAKAPATFAAQP